MADKNKLIPIIKRWEGGYSDNPNDRGGATNSGVTLAVYQSVYGKSKTKNDLKKMTNEQWDYIFTKLYWNKWKADEIKNQSIANILVDWVWMSGYGTIKCSKLIAKYLREDGTEYKPTINQYRYDEIEKNSEDCGYIDENHMWILTDTVKCFECNG